MEIRTAQACAEQETNRRTAGVKGNKTENENPRRNAILRYRTESLG